MIAELHLGAVRYRNCLSENARCGIFATGIRTFVDSPGPAQRLNERRRDPSVALLPQDDLPSSGRSVENRKGAAYNRVVLFAGQEPNRIQRILPGEEVRPGGQPLFRAEEIVNGLRDSRAVYRYERHRLR